MARTKISEFSATPANNTDIDSINISEGCSPSGINDAIRELMAQLKDFQTGAVGDSFNGPVGAATASTGAFTTLSATGAITSTLATGSAPLVIASTTKVANLNVDLLDGADWAAPAALGSTTPAAVSATTLTTSSTVTLNGGTANGVAYLNGSKVVTSGSALTFDGSQLGIATASSTSNGLKLNSGNAGANYVFYRDGTTGLLQLYGNQTGFNGLLVSGVDGQQYLSDPAKHIWSVSNSEQMRLTSTGLGIGTSSPAVKFVVSNAGANGYEFDPANSFISSYNRSTSAWTAVTFRAGSYTWNINNSIDALKLDSSGNLGLGVTPSAWATLRGLQNGRANLVGYASNAEGAWLTSNAFYDGSWKYQTSSQATHYQQLSGVHSWHIAPSGTAGNAITFTQAMTLDASGNLAIGYTAGSYRLTAARSAGETQLAVTTAQNSGSSGSPLNIDIDFLGYADGNKARIRAIEQSGNTNASPLTFWTNNGSGSFAERARIDSSGNLLVGLTADSYQPSKGVAINAQNSSRIAVGHASGTASGDYYCSFAYNGGVIGSISQSGTAAVLFNVTSDQRLKENIADADSASALIDSLQVRKFDWKTDGNHQRYGFVAQELLTVAPEAVHQPEDPEEMMAVDYSKLVPMLVKEIQSLRKRLVDAGI